MKVLLVEFNLTNKMIAYVKDGVNLSYLTITFTFIVSHVSFYSNFSHLLVISLAMLCQRHVNMP
jgi:hypothetical protein